MRQKKKAIPLAVVGAGRAGLALAMAVRRRGYALTGIVARTRPSATRASRLAGRGAGTLDLGAAAVPARVILICVPDGEIGNVAAALAALPAPGIAGKVVLHVSGALTTAPLEPARLAGVSIGSLHPLVSFPEPGGDLPDLSGITFALDGEPRALSAGRALTRALGGVPLVVTPEARGAYHLAASLVANGLVALLDGGLDLAARRLGLSPRRVHEVFLPLAISALFNVARSGTRDALTGPVARGDDATVERHLSVLAEESPGLRDLYRAVSLRALEMATRAGRIEPERADRIARLLRRD